MITHFHTGLTHVKISPINTAETQFRVRLQFSVIERPEAVEFDVSAEQLIVLLQALKNVQTEYRLPTPPPRKRGKPALHIVRDDE